ncbi:membrane protein [Bacillus alveayuensis]|uniref:YkvI family membrane protein n=1 Tax=Aeribacillus alveayuensis TaxID=279215 RepID=UPI0005D10E9C|nr:membrane protein [Bacillus alveayuensis]
MKQSIQIAGAFIGLIVGAGFASGQEILQFFTSFGWLGILGTMLATLLFAFLGMNLTQLGSKMQTTSHKAVIYSICGRYLGVVVDMMITFFLFGVLVVMIAGAGSIFEQQFGVPSIVGSIFMTIITILTVSLNIQRVISMIGLITPFLLVLVVIISGYSLATMEHSLLDTNQLIDPQYAAASNWGLGALLYVSYNIAAGAAMLVVMGGAVKDEKTAGLGGILGGIGLGVLILLINLGMLAKVETIMGVDMPMLYLANELSPIVGMFMSIILLGMIYNTAVGMLYAFSARIVKPQHDKFKMFVALFGTTAFAASFIGFITLVGTLYPLMGYLGFTLIAAIVIAWIKEIQNKRNSPVGINGSSRF